MINLIKNVVLHLEEKWGANGIVGHLQMMAFWALWASVDIFVFHLTPDPTTLGVICAFMIVPPFMLPAQDIDISERGQLFLLTYLPSATFGLAGGLGIFKVVSGMLGLKAPAIVPVCFSSGLTLLFAVCVYIAYLSIGAMSREKRYHAFLDLNPHESLKLVIVHLKQIKRHVLADQILSAYIDRQYELISPESEEEDLGESLLGQAENELLTQCNHTRDSVRQRILSEIDGASRAIWQNNEPNGQIQRRRRRRQSNLT